MKQTEPELDGFTDPADATGFLTARDGDRDRKDRILAALVRRSQRGENPDLVSALLWLGLWPGLDDIFRTYQGHFRDDPAEAVSAITAVFTDLVAGLDIEVVRRVACSLVLGTRRNLLRLLRREWRSRERFVPTDPTGTEAFDFAQDGHRRDGASFQTGREPTLHGWLLPVTERDAERSLARLHATLSMLVGADAELLLAVLVLEESQLEAAERLGLTYDAARKRLQRASHLLLTKLKKACPNRPRRVAI